GVNRRIYLDTKKPPERSGGFCERDDQGPKGANRAASNRMGSIKGPAGWSQPCIVALTFFGLNGPTTARTIVTSVAGGFGSMDIWKAIFFCDEIMAVPV